MKSFSLNERIWCNVFIRGHCSDHSRQETLVLRIRKTFIINIFVNLELFRLNMSEYGLHVDKSLPFEATFK